MKKYSDLVYRDLKRNKRRGIYTVLGVILGIVLLTSIFSINNIFKRVKIEEAIRFTGDYEILISNLSREEVEKVKANVKVKNYSKMYIESEGKILSSNFSVYAIDDVGLQNILSKRIVIEKGTYPKSSGEIILEKNTANVLQKNINDRVTLGEKEYRVVGVYEGKITSTDELDSIVYFDENEKKPINMLLNIKDDGGVKEKIDDFISNENYLYIERGNRLSKEDILSVDRKVLRVNEALIDAKIESEGVFKGEISEETIGVMLLNFSIILLTIILIYSSINISIKERIKAFSLLRCLGATEDKIKYLLFKESIIIGLFSIIPGIILGNILAFFILGLIYKETDIAFIGINDASVLDTSIKVIILSVVTIFIGVIVPVIRRDKVNLVEGIKSSRYKQSVKKKRKNKLVRKILGYKGELAYKNIRGNGKGFALTVSILSLIIIIFTGFSSYYLGITKEYKRELNTNLNYEVRLEFPFKTEYIDIKRVVQYIKEKGEELKEITKEDSIVERIDYSLLGNVENDPMIRDKIDFIVLNDDGFREIEDKLTSKVSLEDFKNSGVIVVNGKEMSKVINVGFKPVFDFKKGDDVNIKIAKGEENREINLKYQSSIDGLYIQDYKYLENDDKVAFIISMDSFLKYGEVLKEKDGRFLGRRCDLLFNLKDESRLLEINRFCTLNNGYLIDYKNITEGNMGTLFSLSIIINTILLISLCIATLNIINNKIITLSLREGEVATLISLGMRIKDIKKIILLEGVIEFLYSSLIGGGVSLVILKAIDIIFKFWGEVPSGYFPIHILLIGIAILFIISILSSLLSLRYLKEKELGKLMRGEEYV